MKLPVLCLNPNPCMRLVPAQLRKFTKGRDFACKQYLELPHTETAFRTPKKRRINRFSGQNRRRGKNHVVLLFFSPNRPLQENVITERGPAVHLHSAVSAFRHAINRVFVLPVASLFRRRGFGVYLVDPCPAPSNCLRGAKVYSAHFARHSSLIKR